MQRIGEPAQHLSDEKLTHCSRICFITNHCGCSAFREVFRELYEVLYVVQRWDISGSASLHKFEAVP